MPAGHSTALEPFPYKHPYYWRENVDLIAFALLEAHAGKAGAPLRPADVEKLPGLKGKNIDRELGKLPPTFGP
jgi:hypothetical protein